MGDGGCCSSIDTKPAVSSSLDSNMNSFKLSYCCWLSSSSWFCDCRLQHEQHRHKLQSRADAKQTMAKRNNDRIIPTRRNVSFEIPWKLIFGSGVLKVYVIFVICLVKINAKKESTSNVPQSDPPHRISMLFRLVHVYTNVTYVCKQLAGTKWLPKKRTTKL